MHPVTSHTLHTHRITHTCKHMHAHTVLHTCINFPIVGPEPAHLFTTPEIRLATFFATQPLLRLHLILDLDSKVRSKAVQQRHQLPAEKQFGRRSTSCRVRRDTISQQKLLQSTIELRVADTVIVGFHGVLEGLHEALRLAVRLGMIRRGANVFHTVTAEKLLELLRDERRAVVGNDLIWQAE